MIEDILQALHFAPESATATTVYYFHKFIETLPYLDKK